jgi:TetR/AcrR family transcriptional regulator, regulator of cefoperazone and chloramphenicol sensitivity
MADLDTPPLETELRTADGRMVRGSATRDRLIRAGTQVFFNHGYRAASTRDICLAAQVNPAAIHYHFTDKAGLYRAVMLEPFNAIQRLTDLVKADLPFEQAIRQVFQNIMAPMRSGDPVLMQQIRLHYREMADPSGVLGDAIFEQCQRLFGAVSWLTLRELGLADYDDDVGRLVSCMIGMAFDFYGAQAIRDRFVPTMLREPTDVDLLVERLTMFAAAMLASERGRRANAKAPAKVQR